MNSSRVVHKEGGFEYHNERTARGYSWHFRPVGAVLWAPAPGRKEDVQAMLQDPLKALAWYQRDVARKTDPAAIKAELDQLEAVYAEHSAAGWNRERGSGGPVQVVRAFSSVTDLLTRIEDARQRLQDAQVFHGDLATQAFNEKTWLAHFYPELELPA